MGRQTDMQAGKQETNSEERGINCLFFALLFYLFLSDQFELVNDLGLVRSVTSTDAMDN